MIKNGMKVRDSITGVEGVAVCRSEWLTGCVRITIQPHGLKDGRPIDNHITDEAYCEVVSDKSFRLPTESAAAGPTARPSRAADPGR